MSSNLSNAEILNNLLEGRDLDELTSSGITTLNIFTNKRAKAPYRNSFLYGLRYLDITLNFKFFI